MKLGSLFDGAGTCCFAAELCGITPFWSSEIEKFPLAVTAKRFPNCKQLGDIMKIDGAKIEPVDVITFGSPCQDLSIAGKRAGLEGERSSLFMEAIRVIKEMRHATANEFPRYIIWENVPGAFSSNKGEDFRKVLEEIVRVKDGTSDVPRPSGGKWRSCGSIMGDDFSLAWRTLDAQFWGVPRDAEESTLSQILEENAPPKYYLSATACRGVLRRAVNRGKELPTLLKIALCLQGKLTIDEIHGMGIFHEGELMPYDGAYVYDSRGNGDGKVVPTLTGDHEDRITDYTAVVIAFNLLQDPIHQDGITPCLSAGNSKNGQGMLGICYIDYAAFNQGVNAKYDFGVDKKTAFALTGKGPGAVCFAIGNGQAYQLRLHEKAGALNCMYDEQALFIGINGNTAGTLDAAEEAIVIYVYVRRLTPTECARLQGMPDWWCADVHHADAPEYKMWGNGMALPNILYVLEGIAKS